ncbi:MAG: alpha/beta fold hydrolase [Candidatus Spechtbacterales bacterium]|nr:alpha/beta fold hydrolase [Candidatus Spechtbacterales bacterium]
MTRVELTTEDNIQIVGNYFPAGKDNAPAVILLHMMPARKESWNDFAPILVKKGFQVLAIDERGHGESTQGGELNYQEFTDKQQQEKKLDVHAAREFFREKDVPLESIFVGGASIGANLALEYIAENFEAKAGFALSPGYNYMGIEALSLIEETHTGQSVFLAAAKNDPNVPDSWHAVEDLSKNGLAEKEVRIFEKGGHGTDMFDEHEELMTELADWLTNFK